MNVHIVHDGQGRILSVHRTVDGLAHHLVGHGENPTVAGVDSFGIEGLNDAFSQNATIKVSFSDVPEVIVERHAVFV